MSSEPDGAAGRSGTARESSEPLFTDVEATLLAMQDVVGRKWQPIIVYHLLADGPLGFSALKDSVDGISSKMLSESLGELETAGLVDRTLLSDRPVRVEYELTERGAALEPLVTAMLEWGSEHDVAAVGDESGHRGEETRSPQPAAVTGTEGR